MARIVRKTWRHQGFWHFNTPTGLSGSIRRWAYKYIKATTAQWIGLIFADRVNALESIVDDFQQRTIPDLCKLHGFTFYIWNGRFNIIHLCHAPH